jgi:hypothetical protein
MEEFFAKIFIECMIENYRFFSDYDFKELLKSQRLDENFAKKFNILVGEYINNHNIEGYHLRNNTWKPQNMLRYHPKIKSIIKQLKLHIELENSLDPFDITSCNIVQKINNYIYVCELPALQ